MADVSKFKKLKGRRDELGAPPSLEEASVNLTAPELAPVARTEATHAGLVETTNTGRIDGHASRKTNRIRAIAQREGVLLVEVLEKALAAYEEKSSS